MTIAIPQGVIGESLARGLCTQTFADIYERMRKAPTILPGKWSRTAIFKAWIKSNRKALEPVLLSEDHHDCGKKSSHDFFALIMEDAFIGIACYRIYAHRDDNEFRLARGLISRHAYARYIQSTHDTDPKKFGLLMYPHIKTVMAMADEGCKDEVMFTAHDSGVGVWEPHKEWEGFLMMKTFVAADAIDGHGKIGMVWRKYNEKNC